MPLELLWAPWHVTKTQHAHACNHTTHSNDTKRHTQHYTTRYTATLPRARRPRRTTAWQSATATASMATTVSRQRTQVKTAVRTPCIPPGGSRPSALLPRCTVASGNAFVLQPCRHLTPFTGGAPGQAPGHHHYPAPDTQSSYTCFISYRLSHHPQPCRVYPRRLCASHEQAAAAAAVGRAPHRHAHRWQRTTNLASTTSTMPQRSSRTPFIHAFFHRRDCRSGHVPSPTY